ncbi:efflux RND transporter periplasmic adaptor subunit [Thermostaphylospora chromogena]|uniref:Multidrug efflux pump subunit AcrA (Membrane-fusion protein) n=1 Tax=Thermostaphylospora chromogena TaxID=35622 RepID=A0A1H1I1L0_9ACTN|nr:peptidoglycan-binding protein [Thermostaphylospora chromogena]SDR31469.1 Multidrug efflux pump subunit AcrA (membrane-fusion protein) [Thermostaphylospora chromogena]
MTRKGALLAGVAVAAGAAAVLGGAGVAALGFEGGRPAASATPAVPATAEITREDLVDTQAVSGKLTYAGEHKIRAGGSGTVTALPEEGAVIRRGRALMRVDRRPLVLMYGRLPLYRTLRLGVEDGPDVEQLERNLKALGYGDDMTVDDEFTYATRRAVLEWQRDRGLPETGSVDASQVVFLDGPVRVGERSAAVGDKVGPGQQVMKVTGTRRIVHVDLDTDYQELARKGARVTVELPGDREVEGTISHVGTVAKESGSDDRPGADDASATIDVEITLKGKTGRLDQAPVVVRLESERVEDVLTVPVEALLGLREGGFAVEVVEGTRTRLVAVETGAYGGGRVEISGEGLTEGMKVGVPSK